MVVTAVERGVALRGVASLCEATLTLPKTIDLVATDVPDLSHRRRRRRSADTNVVITYTTVTC